MTSSNEIPRVKQGSDTRNKTPEGTLGTFHTPRHFNRVWTYNGLVRKWSAHDAILGECHFYTNLPSELHALFPRFYGSTPHNKGTLLTMERIWGESGARRLIDGQFDIPDLNRVLDSLHRMHDTRTKFGAPPDANMYANYTAKLETRWVRHREVFERAGITGDVMRRVKRVLQRYESRGCGVWRDVIHGDAVLTNVLLLPEERAGCVWVDPRGMLGDVLCLGGDAMYDYAKVAQSLLGYVWVVAGRGWESGDVGRAGRLVRRVRGEVERVGGTWWGCVAVVCGLVVGLIPLHGRGRERFACVAMGILECLERGDVDVEQIVAACAEVVGDESGGEGRTVD